jgi:hypothetical protein
MTDPNPIQMQIESASAQPDETILKPKPPRKPRAPLDPEVKAKLAANMKKVNEARIAAAKIKNEHKLDAKQAEIAKEANDRLAVIEKKKEQIAKLKESSQQLEQQPPKPPKKSKKQLIVELSDDSDSTDSETDGEDEPEILYVAKKKQTRTRAKSDPSIVKPKKQNKPQTPPQQDDPRPIIKFI